MEKKLDLSALGQSIDSTWGRSSTPRTASYSVKMSLLGNDRLLVSYAAVVTFASERQMIEQKKAYASEADSVVFEVVKRLKSIYKDLTGDALKVKLSKDTEVDSIEIINLNVHNARRTAYYRRKAIFDLA